MFLKIDNYTIQDIMGIFIAFSLFPLVMVIPGFLAGWFLDLFDFRKRLPLTKFTISLVLSIAISPILVYWLSYFFSTRFALIVLFTLLVIAAVIVLFSWRKNQKSARDSQTRASIKYRKQLILLVIAWVIFCTLWLVDWQFGNRLYFNYVSEDYTTRVAIIDAITRTGVPPINPSYYPGHPAQLTFLYYFWYILASLIDIAGGRWVTAYTAMIASVIWCGFVFGGAIALYLRLRSNDGSSKIYRRALIGISLFMVSGMDGVPVVGYMFASKLRYGAIWPDGDIEHWNEQITAWIGSVAWVPNHLAAMLACLVGLMLFIYIRKKALSHQIIAAIFTGISFASALGLSVWVTLVFAVFWVIWMVVIFVQKSDRRLIVLMVFAGIISIIASGPFLAGLMGQDLIGPSIQPIIIEIRRFLPVIGFTKYLPNIVQQFISLIILPINYLFELGFYFIIGLLWIRKYLNSAWRESPFFVPEILLLIIVIIIASFFRSNIIENNDLGWRGWLFGQFVLLIWAVDIIYPLLTKDNLFAFKLMSNKSELKKEIALLILLLSLGFFTSIMDITLLRTSGLLIDVGITGFPNRLSSDSQLGIRTYAARQAFEYINNNLPSDVITQNNPSIAVDRPSGLYGTRQMAISDRTAYGVPKDIFKNMVDQVKVIFESKTLTWEQIDTRLPTIQY